MSTKTLKQRIHSDFLDAKKLREAGKNKAIILGMVKSDILNQEKLLMLTDLDDSQVGSVLTKTAKKLNESLSYHKEENEETLNLKEQLAVVTEYLGAEMTRSEIIIKLNQLFENGINTIPLVMAEFKDCIVNKKTVVEVFNEMKKK